MGKWADRRLGRRRTKYISYISEGHQTQNEYSIVRGNKKIQWQDH